LVTRRSTTNTAHRDIPFVEPYKSPQKRLQGADRTEYMINQFAGRHSNLSSIRPDLIYFAGRSTDLRSFLRAQIEQGACDLTHVDVLTGDDAANIVDEELPSSERLTFDVLFKLATSDPQTVATELLNIRCRNTVPGASGLIALDRDGNPIDKALPILRIAPDGPLTQEDLAWPTGAPLNPATTCGRTR
jgi:hypothetical protein